MEVAILTVGDELLTGDTENTNASWLARQVTERGASVVRMLTVPDDVGIIEETVREWGDAFDAVIVTGGLGGTHDDVTMDAVAAAFDTELVVDPEVRADVAETAAAYREEHPETVEEYDFELDVDAWSTLPDGARAVTNPVGLCAGCVIENVYVLPGIPEEMKATFDAMADDFGGDAVSTTLYTPAPEGALTSHLSGVRDEFDVAVGSYPSGGPAHNRVKIVGTDAGAVEAAAEWLEARIDVVDEAADPGGDAADERRAEGERADR